MRQHLSGEFDMVLTEIARDNPRSLKVNALQLDHVTLNNCLSCNYLLTHEMRNSQPLPFQAHINVGFEVVSSSSFEGTEFDIVCWRWR